LDLEIRAYEEADEEAVVALWREALPATAPHNEPAITIRKKLEVDRDLFLVATIGGAVAGTAMGGYDGHRGWIYSVAVLPECRRQKIATALVEHVIAELQKLDCPKINLQITASNAGVVGFYESLGFRVEERISMGKRLK